MSVVVSDRANLHYLEQLLEPKERLYVESRAQGSPPEAAARVAGYKDAAAKAQQLEADDKVITALQYYLRVQRHAEEYTRQDVANGIRDAIDVASTANEMISGWKEIGKLYGHYAPEKREVTHKKAPVEQLTDEELAEMAAIDGEYEVLDFEDEPQGEPHEVSDEPVQAEADHS